MNLKRHNEVTRWIVVISIVVVAVCFVENNVLPWAGIEWETIFVLNKPGGTISNLVYAFVVSFLVYFWVYGAWKKYAYLGEKMVEKLQENPKWYIAISYEKIGLKSEYTVIKVAMPFFLFKQLADWHFAQIFEWCPGMADDAAPSSLMGGNWGAAQNTSNRSSRGCGSGTCRGGESLG